MVEFDVTKWTYENLTHCEKIRIDSVAHAIELVNRVMKKELGECIEFEHDDLGAITCIVGQSIGTLAFSPKYDKNNHSLTGFQRAVPMDDTQEKELVFVDSFQVLSSVRKGTLLKATDVTRGLEYILENHDFPTFLNWRPGC